MKGNLLASLRRSEIEELRAMLDSRDFRNNIGHRGRQDSNVYDNTTTDPAGLVVGAGTGTEPEGSGIDTTGDTASLPSLGDPFFDVWNLNHQDGLGFSGEQLLTLADELGNNEDWGDFQWLESEHGG